MRHASLGCLIALSLWAAGRSHGQDQPSRVEHNAFVSPANPKTRVKVEKKFEYVGTVPFTIDAQAGGNRYVFVDATRDKHIRQMFIIQQEGFFASSEEIYRYKITSPSKLGNFDYQHSVTMYDNNSNIREEPGKEADLTQRFLTGHGYFLEPELVMSRFARPADKEQKHEIIFSALRISLLSDIVSRTSPRDPTLWRSNRLSGKLTRTAGEIFE